HLAQRLDDDARVHADGARHVVGEDEAVAEALDVAVEDEADEPELGVDHRAARVAADDVAGADEAEGRLEVELGQLLEPARIEVEGLLAVELAVPREQPV